MSARYLMFAVLFVAAASCTVDPVPGTDAGADAGTTDAGPTVERLFNVIPAAPYLWPGGLTTADAFFQTDDGGPWALEVTNVSGGTVTLLRSTLDAAHPRAQAIVELPLTATSLDEVRFTVRATRGAEVFEKVASVGVYDLTAAESGFEVYVVAQADEVTSGTPARYRVRVISHGGFSGKVSLIAGDNVEGFRAVRFTQQVLDVTPSAPAETTVEVDMMPSAQFAAVPLFAASGRKYVVASAPLIAIVPAASPWSALMPERRLFALPGTVVPFTPRIETTGTSLAWATSVALSGAPAGVTVQSDGLHLSAAVAPGAYRFDVTGQGPGGATATASQRLVVLDPATLVGGKLPKTTAVHGVAAAGQTPVELVGPAARQRLDSTGWTWLGEDGSFVTTFARGTVRYEGRQTPGGLLAMREVDTNPSGFGTRFWQVSARGDGVRAPSVAVDGLGETWLAAGSTDQGLAVFRRGTVAGGVPVKDGLPLAAGSSLAFIAAGGNTVALALAEPSGVTTWGLTRSTWTWNALPAMTVTLAGGDPSLMAFDADSAGRVVLAWVGGDEDVHVARLEGGAWTEVGRFTPAVGAIVLSVDLRVASSGAMTVVWSEAAHVLVPGTWPAPAAATRIGVAQGNVGAWVQRFLTAGDSTAAVAGPRFDLDAAGVPVIAFSEGGQLVVKRGN